MASNFDYFHGAGSQVNKYTSSVYLCTCLLDTVFLYSIAPSTSASSVMRMTTPLKASCQ